VFPKKLLLLCLLLSLAGLSLAANTPDEPDVTRATLDNGLRVIIVRNPLAPVVTVQENYLVGGNETPANFPGMAHAQEHMAFRGCADLSADQIAAIFAQLGGDNNADTQQSITQYYETVPAQDLGIALRVDAACMRDIVDSDAQWTQERGAIEQEVARDLSNPTYKFLTRMNEDMFAGTPYAHDPLGTRPSFDATTGKMLKDFYRTWYTPSNAILVITGQVDPVATLALVKQVYGDIPKRPVPARPQIELQPVKAEHFTLPSDFPYTLSIVAYRFPGTDSPDYAAALILADVLASQRGNIYGLVPEGKVLEAGFEVAEKYRKASVGLAYSVVPASASPEPAEQSLQQIIADYAAQGVPADLVDASKRGEIAANEFSRNSIPGLASLWSDAVASEGRQSPEEDIDAIKKVTLADVNRVAKKYLVNQNAIVATLKPEPSGKPVAGKGFGGAEKVTVAPTKPVALPDWAQDLTRPVAVPHWDVNPVDMTLSNGIRLIVQTEKVSPTVTIAGQIHTQPNMQVPKGQEGLSSVMGGLFSYGTTSLDRIAFQKALDDIAANESAGTSFSLQVLKTYLDRGVQLLADNELHPAFPAPAFKVVQQQTADSVAGLLQSPDYHAGRALLEGLVPKGDPALRQATPQTVSALNQQDLVNYYGQIFRPDMTTIVVIGDITPDEAKTEIEKWFGKWQATGSKPDVDLPPVPPNGPSAHEVPDPTRVQDEVQLSEELPMNRFTPDYYALQLANHILGGGFYATRLYRDLREKAGLVYTVSNQLDAGKTRTAFTVAYASDPDKVSRAKAMVVQDLTDMQKTNAEPHELQQAKALLLRQIPLTEASESDVAAGLLGRAIIGLPLDEPIRAAQRYDALTADQVRTAFNRWIRPSDLVQVIQGPPPK
jgi:zinc protease